jgi:hypothetical protein
LGFLPTSSLVNAHASQPTNLSDESRGGGGLVLECRRELLLLDVVTGETVDTGFDQNHAAKL